MSLQAAAEFYDVLIDVGIILKLRGRKNKSGYRVATIDNRHIASLGDIKFVLATDLEEFPTLLVYEVVGENRIKLFHCVYTSNMVIAETFFMGKWVRLLRRYAETLRGHNAKKAESRSRKARARKQVRDSEPPSDTESEERVEEQVRG